MLPGQIVGQKLLWLGGYGVLNSPGPWEMTLLGSLALLEEVCSGSAQCGRELPLACRRQPPSGPLWSKIYNTQLVFQHHDSMHAYVSHHDDKGQNL